jgi:hypothetical protein
MARKKPKKPEALGDEIRNLLAQPLDGEGKNNIQRVAWFDCKVPFHPGPAVPSSGPALRRKAFPEERGGQYDGGGAASVATGRGYRRASPNHPWFR